MRILFDHNVPAPLRRHLSGHQIDTAAERGWEGLNNGFLLNVADENDYEVLITADQNIRYQQNLAGRRIGILVLMDNLWPKVRLKAEDIREALDELLPGEYREIQI